MQHEVQTRRVQFAGALGDMLDARLELPNTEPAAFAVFTHCFTCNKNYKAVGHIARVLASAGIAVLRFDFTGLGGSQGDFSDTTFSTNLHDLAAAAAYLEQHYAAPRLLIGHSLGGAAAIVGAGEIPSVEGVALLATPSTTDSIRERLAMRAPAIAHAGESEVELGGQTFRIKQQLLDDLARHDVEGAMKALTGKATIVVHSQADRTLPIAHGETLFGSASQPKSFFALPDADHLFSDVRHATAIGTILTQWAQMHILAT